MYNARGDGDPYDKSRDLTPTSLGKQICIFLNMLENGLRLKPKLQALDSLEMSARLTKEERNKIIDALIDDTRTKNVLKQEPVEFREQS
jgi:hypothetical protein